MTAITLTDLSNAALDAATIAAIANSTDPAVVDRLGVSRPTMVGLAAMYPNAQPSAIAAAISQVAAAASATAAAASALLAGGLTAVGLPYANGAATYVPQGATAFSLTSGGSGGSNGTNILATYSGGTLTTNPVIYFDIVGGIVVNVRMTSGGLYIGTGTPTMPTVALPGSAGGAALTLTAGKIIANGAQYWVGSTDGTTAALYTNNAGSPAVYPTGAQLVMPMASLVQTLAARSPGYLVAPAVTDPLYKVLQIQIYQSVAGVAITLPALMCVREHGRDATSGGRYRLRLASFDGVSTYVSSIREQGNGTYLAVDSTYTGEKWIGLYSTDTSLGIAANTLIGRARVDFGAGAVFGTYVGTISYALGGVYPDKVQNGARFVNDVREQVRTYPVGMSIDATNVQFKGIKKLRLFGADNSKFYSVRYFFRNDSGTRFNFTISQHTDAAGTGTTDVCAFSSTGANYSGMVEFPMSALGGSGITGSVVIDFGATSSTFNVTRGFSSETFTTMAVRNDSLFTSAASDAYVDGRVTAVLAAAVVTPGSRIPFADTMATDYLRKIFKSFALYGGDPSHSYIVKSFQLWDFTTYSQAVIVIRDLTTGADVCRYAVQSPGASPLATFVTTLPTKIKFTDSTLTPSAIYAVADMSWADALTGGNVSTSYTTAVQAGLHVSVIKSDEMIADYLDRDMTHETIRVGSAESITTLRAAVEGTQITVGTGTCNRSHYGNRLLFDLVEPVDYSATFLAFPEFTEIRGVGVDATRIIRDTPDVDHDAMLEFHYDGKISDLTIFSDSGDGGAWAGEYCIHSDKFNTGLVGGISQNRRFRQKFQRLKLIGGPLQNAWLFGCGISSGQTIVFDDVYAEHQYPVTTIPAFGFHNTAPLVSNPVLVGGYKPATVIMRGCRSPDPIGAYVMSLGTGHGAHDRLVLHGCEFNLVKHEVAGSGEVVTDKAKDRFEWRIGGVHAGPILQTDTDGMWVLGTTAGQVPSGSAAALIFGAVDELGRGELWIKDTHITITGITQANPGVISCSGNHGLWVGRSAPISGVAGMTGINNAYTVASVPSPTTFTVALAGTPVDTTGFGAYTSGGIVGIKSLGTRLGDCSSVNKTLTIGSQTFTFNADYRGQSNATIRAAINAVITTYPVAEVDIQTEIYPDCGYNRRLTNSSGSTIPAGSFVKRVGATISLASGTDAVYGWVFRPILNGLSGIVVTTKLVHAAYITNAAGDGEFGITSGLLDYGAATKIGRVESSIVQRY